MKPCKRGHTSGRKPSGACKECARIANKARKRSWLEVRDRASELRRVNERRRTDPAYAAKIQRRVRDYRGLPVETRPKPTLCEWPGCQRKAYALDHCHATGVFRGWLCNMHNLGLGKIGDTADSLRAGLDYLARAESEAWLAVPGHGLPTPPKKPRRTR